MSDEIRRAQAGLNFSRWPDYSARQKELIWRRSLVRLRGKMMPPPAYHLVHPVLSTQEVDALEKHLQPSFDGPLSHWHPDELLAWPAVPWAGATVTGVMEVPQGSITEPLVLDGGVLLCRGDLELSAGLTGRGAVLVEGRLTVKGLRSMVGPVALLGYREVTLESSQGVARLTGYVASAGEVTTNGVEIEERPNFQLQVEGLKEVQLDFCRDDGELGEYAERSMVIRFGWGQYVLWEPELQIVRRANTLEQALDAAAKMIAADPATSAAVWENEFRQSWRDQLSELESQADPANFLARPERSVFVTSPPP
jgi:hypothetical protein